MNRNATWRSSPKNAVVLALVLLLAVPAIAAAATINGTFDDDDGSPHEGNIEAVASARITKGCTRDGTRFCPGRETTRGQMASFLVRAVKAPAAERDYFTDDNGTAHEDSFNRLAAVGVVTGSNGKVFPNELMRRDVMAVWLSRAFDIAPSATNRFSDVADDHPAVGAINGIAAAGVTLGCDRAGTRYCPAGTVTRAQMTSFLTRAQATDERPLWLDVTGSVEVEGEYDYYTFEAEYGDVLSWVPEQGFYWSFKAHLFDDRGSRVGGEFQRSQAYHRFDRAGTYTLRVGGSTGGYAAKVYRVTVPYTYELTFGSRVVGDPEARPGDGDGNLWYLGQVDQWWFRAEAGDRYSWEPHNGFPWDASAQLRGADGLPVENFGQYAEAVTIPESGLYRLIVWGKKAPVSYEFTFHDISG